MSSGSITFYILSAVILVFSLLSVTSRRLLRAAIYLLFVLIGTAIFYLLLDYLFLAAVQVIVYMGGVLVLIIFSILLTSHLAERLQTVPLLTGIVSALACVIGAVTVLSVLFSQQMTVSEGTDMAYDVSAIGTSLLSYEKFGYVLPFEVISILLLAALIGAIVVAKRPKNSKKIDND
ncbi:MAG: NADH-quinone oxidoreductase subunit J [Saprospiraceae bacterium]|nr:NADH-quinone oxidoreductase subunit J [Saprospiraceae bacterium]